MSFFDRAKAAAQDLAAKADTALQNAGMAPTGATGGPEGLLRDLGVLAYLEATGRPASLEDRERVMSQLRQLESSGQLDGALRLGSASGGVSAPPPPGTSAPPPPGVASPPAPKGGGSAAPTSGDAAAYPPAAGQEAPPVTPASQPPPPPSWA